MQANEKFTYPIKSVDIRQEGGGDSTWQYNRRAFQSRRDGTNRNHYASGQNCRDGTRRNHCALHGTGVTVGLDSIHGNQTLLLPAFQSTVYCEPASSKRDTFLPLSSNSLWNKTERLKKKCCAIKVMLSTIFDSMWGLTFEAEIFSDWAWVCV